jgi:hypothetical protein
VCCSPCDDTHFFAFFSPSHFIAFNRSLRQLQLSWLLKAEARPEGPQVVGVRAAEEELQEFIA